MRKTKNKLIWTPLLAMILLFGAVSVSAHTVVWSTVVPATDAIVSGTVNFTVSTENLDDLTADNLVVFITALDGQSYIVNETLGGFNSTANSSLLEGSWDSTLTQDGTWSVILGVNYANGTGAGANITAFNIVIGNTNPTPTWTTTLPTAGSQVSTTTVQATITEEVQACNFIYEPIASLKLAMTAIDTNLTTYSVTADISTVGSRHINNALIECQDSSGGAFVNTAIRDFEIVNVQGGAPILQPQPIKTAISTNMKLGIGIILAIVVIVVLFSLASGGKKGKR